jgi:hypothetical protein
MAMSKRQKREWPWNNAPSKRHVWKVEHQNVDRCQRCGSGFHRIADARAAVYCFPTPAWLSAHPDDDGKHG